MPRTVLTPSQIESIPRLCVRHGDQRRLARKWGVSEKTISYHALGGKSHRYLQPSKATA